VSQFNLKRVVLKRVHETKTGTQRYCQHDNLKRVASKKGA
jgi:hypothetical protein